MNLAVYVLFIFLEKIVPLFPLRFIQRIAKLKGLFFYYFIPVRKKAARKNIKLAFPEKSETEIISILKGAYINVMTVIFEFFVLPKLNSRKILRLLNPGELEMINEKLKSGKGLVIVSAHFGNWELTAYGAALLTGNPFNVIVKEQSNTLVDRRINRIRELRGNKMIEMSSSAREVLTLLKNNKVIAMLSDQSAPKENSVKVKFFIDNVPAFEGAARFALKTGAPMIFGASVRKPDGSYKIILKDIDTKGLNEYNEDNFRKLTQAHADILVNFIRENPDHWLWFHKRFKHIINY
jgi:KDO2-lipid IV(A) lauroyltransferase